MAYTEIKERNGRNYYYRASSERKGNKVAKKRIYLGVNLSKETLKFKGNEADKKLRKRAKSNKNKILEEIKPKIVKILKENNVKKAGIFGSYASGNIKKTSDIDIIIEPPEGMGFGFARLEEQLRSKLKKKIDLITYLGLNKYLRDRILSQEIRII